MKTVLSMLFLALFAQGEDLHLELLKLPSAPEVKWLETNEVAVQMATSGRSVRLASENRSRFPSVTTTEWTTEEEAIKIASRRQVSLAYNGDQPQPGFPDRLGIESWEALRNFIVARRGMGIGIWLTLQYDKSTGGYRQISIGKQTEGYDSFIAMLQDIATGLDILINQIKDRNDYMQGTHVWAEVAVTYFNDVAEIRPKPFGLVIAREQGTRETLNAQKVTESFTSLNEYDLEVMVAPFPKIKRFELQLSLTNNIVATMIWTKETGVQLASWPKDFPEEVEENYVAISGWLFNGTRIRMKVSSANGEETYTEHGDRLSKPTVMAFEDRDTMVIDCPKGADLSVQSTTNLVNWTDRGIVSDVRTGRLFLDFPNEGGMMLFRAGVR